MRIIITLALLLAISIGTKAQRIVPIGNGRTTDTGLIVGSLKVDSVLVFPNYRTTNTNMVLGFDSRGKAVLRINNDSLIYATRRYVDSGFNAISAGSVDSSIYSTVTRLADSLNDLRLYTDSLYTVLSTKQGADSLLLALQIDTLQSDVYVLDSAVGVLVSEMATVQSDIVLIDSAVGVAFGAIAALYDTLPNYVDTAQLNDSLQAIKAAYVPYTGATDGINLGNHSYFADNGVYNSEMSPSYFGVQNDSSTQFSLLEYNQLAVTNSNTAKVMTVNANGLVFPDASVQTFAADSIKYSTKAWRQKGVDSVVALIPSSSTYVPYTGATTDVNIGTHNIITNSVRLSTSPTGTLTNVGQLYFDATNVTPSIPLNANVTLQIGQEEHVRARNNTGVQINDGQVVYINSAQGNNPTIALANADSVNTSEVIGVATENIADNGTGFVTTYGTVNGINTSAFNVGDVLYLSATNGTITNVIPTPPHNVVKIGVALNSTNSGRIFVKPSQAIGQDTTFAAPYNSNKVAPTQRAIGTYVRKIVKDTASALRTAINTKYGTSDTGRAATNIVTGGSLNKVRDSLAALSGGGGSPISATSPSILYKSGSDTLKGASKVVIDSTDGRLILARNVDTSAVSTPYNGGTKIVGRNLMGMSALAIVDTVSIPAALQRALNAQVTSTIIPVFPTIAYTNNFLYGGLMSTGGTVTYVAGAPSTIQHLNYNKALFATASGVNSGAFIRVGSISQSSGIVGGNSKFSLGGGRGTFTFSFPTYLSTERIMVGYWSGATISGTFTGEPSTMLTNLAALFLVKESTDATLFFVHQAAFSAPTRVNTGITPNNEDVYRLTVYVAPNSTYYMQLEILGRTGTRVITINPTTNIPAPLTRFVSYQGVNNGTVGGTVSYGLIQMMEEIY